MLGMVHIVFWKVHFEYRMVYFLLWVFSFAIVGSWFYIFQDNSLLGWVFGDSTDFIGILNGDYVIWADYLLFKIMYLMLWCVFDIVGNILHNGEHLCLHFGCCVFLGWFFGFLDGILLGPKCLGPNCLFFGHGKLGPGQLGPGAQLSEAQFATFWGRTVGPNITYFGSDFSLFSVNSLVPLQIASDNLEEVTLQQNN